ncbi:MAG: hypothetical protein JO261_00825 [Alphaproteobacteria bacterium]|nr:hypothetical protein [Alphaproteobacteria bacterium]MBV9692219.1 hypothetical protein [Alphaproteobacteria bacterium]
MRFEAQSLLGTALALVLATALPVLATTVPPPAGTVHRPFPAHAVRPAAPQKMPPEGFRAPPPGFHGTLPNAKSHAMNLRRPAAGPGHDLGLFHGHDFRNFTLRERSHWERGEWRHVWHNGHLGWWWFADGFWFFYPQPIYPYPLYVGSVEYYDYDDEYGTPDYYWYWCADPEGYYPYVTECSVPWQAVPPVPPAD